jgi:tetratricopeptide (TPR) repeat protein
LKYFLQLSENAEPALQGPEQQKWYARLLDEQDNLRAALARAEKMDGEAGLWISGRLWRFWEDVDLRQGERWLKKFLDRPESHRQPHARAKALYAYGIILYLTVQYSLLREIAEECLATYRALSDPYGEFDGLIVLSRYRFATNDPTCMELAQQALAQAEGLGDVWRQAFALGHLGWTNELDYQQRISSFKKAISLFRKSGDMRQLENHLGILGNLEILGGDFAPAEAHLEEALELSQSMNRRGDVGSIFNGLSRIESMKGNFEKARALLEECITNAAKLGHRNNYLWDSTQLGHLIVQQGQATEAREIFLETAQEFLKDSNIIGVCYSLEGMAGLYAATNQVARAARLIGWADATREQIKDRRPPLEQAAVDKIVAACVAEMGQAAFSDAYQEGRDLSLDEAVAYSLR